MFSSIANILLYICFSILTGFFLFKVIAKHKRPSIHVPVYVIKSMITAVPLLLLVPVIRVVSTLYNGFSVPLMESILTVFLSYSTGQVFLVSIILASCLHACLSSEKKRSNKVAVILVFLLILLASWSSHGASVAGWYGFIGNSLHLLAVAVWIGTLSIVAWYSRDWNEPTRFFRWFSWTAAGSVIIIIVSGFMLMAAIVPQYVQAWLLSYGQLLFIKHLLFFPLLAFGFHHFLLGCRKIKLENMRKIIRSFRIESIIALLIFTLTAFMTEQTPPHEVAQSLQTENISWLMQLFMGDQLRVGHIDLSITIITILLGIIAVILFVKALWTLIRSNQHLKSGLFFFLSMFVVYLGVMLSIEPSEGARDEMVYSTIEEAILQSYDLNAQIDILVTDFQEEEVYVVYTVDQADLVAEKVIQVEGGYNRLPAAMLTIGGTAVVDEQQKIRTFRVRSGNWHNEVFAYTYVTFGMISEPVDVARVQIHYEGGSYIAQLEKNTFINVVSSNEAWADQHPIDFLAEGGQLIETYARNVMEEGVYCH